MEKLLEEKIIHDITEHIKLVMATRKISFQDDSDDAGIILAYMNAIGKRISAEPRKVFFSNELKSKIANKSFLKGSQSMPENEAEKIIDIIDYFQLLFENGEDINNHLSSQIFTSKRQDILFNTWNIKHIHLNKQKAESKSAMKKNRADFLLFCIVDQDSVYFLDARHHPNNDEFSSYSFLQIAFNNEWMKYLGFSEMGAEYVPYSMKPKITNDKELFELYNSNINVAFDFQGHGFIGVATGITGSGDKTENVFRLNQLKKEIRKMPFNLDDYGGFCPISQERVSGLIKFTCNGKINEYNFNFD